MELSIPAAVEVTKLLTIEKFGREGVSTGGGDQRESAISKDPIHGRFPVSRCSTSNTDMACRVTASEQIPVPRTNKVDAGLCVFHSSLPSYEGETTSPQDAKLLFTGKHLQRKAGKAPKNGSICLKRPRSEHSQMSMSKPVYGDCNVPTGKHKSGLTEGTFAERSPATGQKLIIDGKRVDKRYFKPPTKTKMDPFFPKVGLVNSSSSAGGGNILGIYGLKSDIHDVTKHVDELSLNDLLDGSYQYPSLRQDKGKKTANINDNLVIAIKKACSILQPSRPLQSQNGAKLDSNSNRKLNACLLSTNSSLASGTDCNKGENCRAGLASSSSVSREKDTCIGSNTSPLYQPKEILERLALPPAKKLDSLLLDISKPVLSKSLNDIKLSKPISYGAHLPPFPWSYCSGGPCKTPVDTANLSSNRSRWVRIGNIASSLGDAPSFLDLKCLDVNYDNSIKGSDATSSQNSLKFGLPQKDLASFDWQLKLGLPRDISLRKNNADDELTHHENDLHEEFEHSKRRGLDQCQRQLHTPEKLIHAGHSPRALAAAQTLYEFARHSAADQNSGKLRWPKKPSQKAMKARKPRSTGKTDALSSKPRLVLEHTDSVKIMDNTLSSKKPKYTNNKKVDFSYANHVGRAPMKWSSIATSSRSSPSRSDNVEAKQSPSDSVKRGMMPSFKRALDRACDSQSRKAVSLDWGRGRSKHDC
ncbi:hypothetical protein AQUCO_01300168v1 [Aquilegia coerulea]|uniref:Uncharacterized protein n=1 Tax=Aquilegia coerulea TaxID=218851 RepID=A0A2G5E097_AQUCA|nr:hypothetical protein AQUCO_01300168v1 [Aquilegia coerulea]